VVSPHHLLADARITCWPMPALCSLPVRLCTRLRRSAEPGRTLSPTTPTHPPRSSAPAGCTPCRVWSKLRDMRLRNSLLAALPRLQSVMAAFATAPVAVMAPRHAASQAAMLRVFGDPAAVAADRTAVDAFLELPQDVMEAFATQVGCWAAGVCELADDWWLVTDAGG